MSLRGASWWLLLAAALLPARGWAESGAHVAILTDAQAWEKLPPVEEGFGQPLPVWIRALAGSLPRTAATMIDLDHAQRAESSLPPQLRAKLRWIAAEANRCAYAKAYARADYVRAGGQANDLENLTQRLDHLPEKEQLALRFVRQLTEAAYTVSDAQVARLVDWYGEKQVVAMALVAAYSSFQDRLLLSLGVSVEPNGPLPAVKVRFRKPAKPTKGAEAKKDAPGEQHKKTPRRQLSPAARNPPPVPEQVDDPEWTALSFAALRGLLQGQSARRHARIQIPDAEAVRQHVPQGVPQPDDDELRIRWSRLNYGYQPRLTAAWFTGLDRFEEESDLEAVFQESMFWVVTRSVHCFY